LLSLQTFPKTDFSVKRTLTFDFRTLAGRTQYKNGKPVDSCDSILSNISLVTGGIFSWEDLQKSFHFIIEYNVCNCFYGVRYCEPQSSTSCNFP